MRYLLFCTVIFLAACSSEGAPRHGAPSADLQAAVVNWSGNAATLEALLYSGTGATDVASGSVSAAGVLELSLSSPAPSYLSEIAVCPELALSDAKLKTNAFSALKLTENGAYTGRVALASSLAVVAEGLKAPGDYYVQYTYADRAATLKGRCDVNGVAATFSYDLSLEPGWNPVVVGLIGTAAGRQTLGFSSAPVPADAAWFLVR